jgi:dTDP-4-amino-4,6-dideoxygalactose transaminase
MSEMTKRKIAFHKTHITDDEIDAVVEALKSGWTTMGPKTVEFERMFADYIFKDVNSPILYNTSFIHAISLNSATAALHLALKAIGINEDDEVILPTNTFVSTAEVVTYFKARPVLCDVEYDTHNLDTSQLENLVTDRTRAIIPVHFAGQPCDMDDIMEVANRHQLKIIEDAAHALPSYYKGKKIGLIGDITCFSFYATKTLSTGEGGMAVTLDAGFAKKIRTNRLHGISKDAWNRYSDKGSWYYEVVDNGNKYNTTDINSALGIVQLAKLERLRDRRQEIAAMYTEAFAGLSGITIPEIRPDRETCWHLYVIKVDNRDEVIKRLKDRGISSSVHFIPVHMHPYYRDRYGYREEDYPVANQVFRESISLPIYPDLTDEEVQYVIETVAELVGK